MLFQVILSKYFFIEVVDNNYLFFQYYGVMFVIYFILFSFCFLNQAIIMLDITHENYILMLNYYVYNKIKIIQEKYI
jgi:hypothetical protein